MDTDQTKYDDTQNLSDHNRDWIRSEAHGLVGLAIWQEGLNELHTSGQEMATAHPGGRKAKQKSQ